MSSQKHPSVRLSQQTFPSASTSSSSAMTPAKKSKRQVTVSMFEKWQRNYDCDHQTLSWLRCNMDKADRNLVALLWCSVCRNYQEKICSIKNYSSAWVTGTDNQRTSNVLEHVVYNQHKAAMSHLHTAQAKASSEPVTSYAPIVRALLMLDKPERARMRCKFDVCYLMAKEGIAFEKFLSLCKLEARHEVDLGHAYRTAPSAKSFTHYITQAQCEQFFPVSRRDKVLQLLN